MMMMITLAEWFIIIHDLFFSFLYNQFNPPPKLVIKNKVLLFKSRHFWRRSLESWGWGQADHHFIDDDLDHHHHRSTWHLKKKKKKKLKWRHQKWQCRWWWRWWSAPQLVKHLPTIAYLNCELNKKVMRCVKTQLAMKVLSLVSWCVSWWWW